MANESIPEVPAVPAIPVTPGNQTSEYQITKAAGWINLLGLIIGGILSIGPSLIGSANPNSKYAIIGGTVIGLATVINKTLIALGYAKSRSDLKTEQIKASAALTLQSQSAASALPLS